MEKLIRIKRLIKQLNEYRDSYYNEARPVVSDVAYDRLFDELSELEKDTGIVYANSPTQTVGYVVKSELEKVKHSHPMLSLDKTKSVDDLVKFAGEKDCILSLKMDGLTCLLTYENGELVQAETRGDGEVGELITHNARVFENIPLTIDYKGHFEIEGEAIITYDDFNKINEPLSGDKKYKNPRNLASGSVRQLDSKTAAKRHIKFIAWKVPTEVASNSFINRLQYAAELGFETVPFLPIRGNSNAEFINIVIEQLQKQAKEGSFPIDGLVVTYNDITYGELSIPGIGTSQSKELAAAFSTWNEFRDASVGFYNFTQLDGFGDVLNNNIHSWFTDMCDIADKLASFMTFETGVNQNTDDSLNSKSFVVTGKVFRFKNRDEVKAEIEKRGGKVTGSVTKSTYALINNDIESNSSKNKKAKELGVKIITEDQLIEMLNM